MSKQVVIDVPDWVDDSLAERLKKMLIAKIREEIERDYIDMITYISLCVFQKREMLNLTSRRS